MTQDLMADLRESLGLPRYRFMCEECDVQIAPEQRLCETCQNEHDERTYQYWYVDRHN